MNKPQYIIKEIDKNKSMLYSWFMAMHTRIDIILVYTNDIDAKNIVSRIKDELHRIEKLANHFNKESELFKLNQSAGEITEVSEELYNMIDYCIRYNSLTYGYFDITVNSQPFDKENIKHIKLMDDHSIQFLKQGIQIDLNGYLKGYALDKTKDILAEENITDALLNFGNSSIAAIGNQPFGHGWKISTGHNNTHSQQEIVLHNQCFTTSGNEVETRKHIIDPNNGKYIEGVKNISVITDKAAEGEILSTALFVADTKIRKRIQQQFSVSIFSL